MQYAVVTSEILTSPHNLRMSKIAQRLDQAMQSSGLSQYRLWKLSGVSQPTIARIRSGISLEPDKSTVEKLAKVLGVSYAWLYDGTDAATDEGRHELERAQSLVVPTVTPVVGHVQGGDDGYLIELEYPAGHGDGFLMHYSKDANAYGLRVKGDSMRPRIKPGEYIVCEPNQEVRPGDDVVAILADGRRMVKELLWVRDGEVSFGSISNGFAPITIPLTEVQAIHYVAAIMPRGAFQVDIAQHQEQAINSDPQEALRKAMNPQTEW